PPPRAPRPLVRLRRGGRPAHLGRTDLPARRPRDAGLRPAGRQRGGALETAPRGEAVGRGARPLRPPLPARRPPPRPEGVGLPDGRAGLLPRVAARRVRDEVVPRLPAAQVRRGPPAAGRAGAPPARPCSSRRAVVPQLTLWGCLPHNSAGC